MEQIVFALVLVFLGIILLLRFANWLHYFRRELKHLRGEIRRTRGKEQKYWIRKKRKLWFSLIPFVRY